MLVTNNTETKRPCEVVLIGNEKGGCGKTTTTLALANCLTELGFKVCCVDLDPSGNLTCAALPDEPEKVLYDVFEIATMQVLTEDKDAERAKLIQERRELLKRIEQIDLLLNEE